jgi:hypothetical protein
MRSCEAVEAFSNHSNFPPNQRSRCTTKVGRTRAGLTDESVKSFPPCCRGTDHIFRLRTSFSRCIFTSIRPPWRFRGKSCREFCCAPLQLRSVAGLIPAFRHISTTGIPGSPGLLMSAFCAFVCFHSRILLSPPG